MVTHTDGYVNKTEHANQDQVDDFISFNSSATNDITLTHPKGGRKAIELQKPLLVAMAQENRYDYSSDKYEGDRRVDEVFDEALCDVAELSLQQAGMADCDVPIQKLRALMIQEARDLNNTELADHISQYSSEKIKQFGLKMAYSVSTYRKAKNEVMDTAPETLLDATFIAVHALFWNGVLIPAPVTKKYDLLYNAGPAASEYADAVRNSALYAIVNDLLDIVIEHLDFQADKTATELRNLIGVFAHAAYIDRSIENYDQTAQHSFDLSSAPSGRWITGQISKLKLSEVKTMFDDIYQELLKYVIESGAVTEPVLVSYDLTKIEGLGITEFDDTFLTEDGRWRFASLAFTDPDLEFAFGLRLLKSKARRSEVLSTLLQGLTSMVDVELFMADGEFDGTEDIEACRKFVPGKWVIPVQDYSESRGRDEDFARLSEKIQPGETAYLRSAGYEDLHPPVQMIGVYETSDNPATSDKIKAYYTDIYLPSDPEKREKKIREIRGLYNQRSKIEEEFKSSKNGFDVATDSDDPVRKSFYLHMSVLFHNLYKIVNTVPAPNSGLELDTTEKEILEIIRLLAFNKLVRPGPWAHQFEGP